MKKFSLEIEAVNNGYRIRILDSEREVYTGIADHGIPFGCKVTVRDFKMEWQRADTGQSAGESTGFGVLLHMDGGHLPYYVPL